MLVLFGEIVILFTHVHLHSVALSFHDMISLVWTLMINQPDQQLKLAKWARRQSLFERQFFAILN